MVNTALEACAWLCLRLMHGSCLRLVHGQYGARGLCRGRA